MVLGPSALRDGSQNRALRLPPCGATSPYQRITCRLEMQLGEVDKEGTDINSGQRDREITIVLSFAKDASLSLSHRVACKSLPL